MGKGHEIKNVILFDILKSYYFDFYDGHAHVVERGGEDFSILKNPTAPVGTFACPPLSASLGVVTRQTDTI